MTETCTPVAGYKMTKLNESYTVLNAYHSVHKCCLINTPQPKQLLDTIVFISFAFQLISLILFLIRIYSKRKRQRHLGFKILKKKETKHLGNSWTKSYLI